jgi:hypothetical protein
MDDLKTSMVTFLRQDDMPDFVAVLIPLVATGDPWSRRSWPSSRAWRHRLVSWLRAQPGTNWDEQGRLVGFGLTQRRTARGRGREMATFVLIDRRERLHGIGVLIKPEHDARQSGSANEQIGRADQMGGGVSKEERAGAFEAY